MLVAAALVGACQSVGAHFAADPAAARATTDGVFGGIVTRFEHVEREAAMRASRRLISRNLLTPSRAFDDTAAFFAAPKPAERTTGWLGIAERDRYYVAPDLGDALPARAGETRHAFRLRKLRDDEFAWSERTVFGIGDATPSAVAHLVTAWIAGGERGDSALTRAQLRAAFPRSTAEWGRVFRRASSSATRDGAGAWTQHHVVVFDLKRASVAYPALATWLRDYIVPLQGHARIHNGTHTWLDLSVRNESLTVRLRSRDGMLLPLEGGDAPLPPVATIETDLTVKLLVFRLGFRALRAHFVTVHTPTERGWELRFNEEPDWQLPPLTARMLRAPLRRPFARDGALFRIAARRAPGDPQTFLARQVELAVQESAILRFVSRLAGSGISAFVDGADRDLSAFFSAAFGALQRDLADHTAMAETQSPRR